MVVTPIRKKQLAIGSGLAVLTLFAYSRVARNGFINLDDNDYVTENLHVQAGLTWKGFVWALTSGHSANWHPLTWLSHMLDCQVFGPNPAGHHLVNVALHLASSLLLFHLFVRMTASVWPSAFVAAAFALHPLHVESVAWVAERKDVLSALAWILTTLAYVRWVAKPAPGRYALLFACYGLGLLAKPMLVTLPFTLLLIDGWPLRRIGAPWNDVSGFARLAREKIPLFALAAASCVVTYLVQRAAGAMSLGDQIPLALRAQNAAVAYVGYLWKALFPARLAVFYPHPVEAYPAWQVAGAALFILGTTVFLLRAGRERPWLGVGWLWFLGTLVPVIGLVQVGSQAMADRYMYLPMIGLSAAIAFEAAELAKRGNAARAVCAVVFTLSVATWTTLTWRQVGFWRDDATLFGHVVEVMPDNYLAHGILGNVHLRERRLVQAEAEFREALRLRPSYAQGHSNLGMARELAGRPEEAMSEYQIALRWSPNLPEAHHNLALLLGARGMTDQAIEHFEAALRENPDLAEAHFNFGVLLMKVGRPDDAIAHFERALALKPGFAEARANLEAARAARSSRPSSH